MGAWDFVFLHSDWNFDLIEKLTPLAPPLGVGAWRWCMTRPGWIFPLGTRLHATIFTDSGIPSADIRLMTLTAISASLL